MPQQNAEASPKPWLIYALGGGWGHLMRGLSLARLAARHRPVHLLVNSPYSNCVNGHESQCNLRLTLRQGGTELAATRAWVQSILRERDWGAWIIDTFPRGLGGELVEPLEDALACNPDHSQRCILIHRDLNPDYVRAKGLNDFVARHYGLVLVPGEREATSLTLTPPAQRTPPWRIRNAEELPSPEAIRARLKLPNAPLVLVCATGNADEQHHFGQLTATLATHLKQSSQAAQATQSTQWSTVALRCLAPTCPPECPEELWLSYWPALECLPLATVVVGAAGYNLVQECAAVGVPLVAFAFRRRYDRQWLRVQRQLAGQVMDQVMGQVMGQVMEESLKSRSKITFANDNSEAIAAVLHQLQLSIAEQSPPSLRWLEPCAASPTYPNGAVIALQKIMQQLQPQN